MEKINYSIKEAKEFSEEERNRFKKIVLSKGEVSERSFDDLMNKNPILLFYPNTKEIEAIGALKIPHDSYKNKVFKKSGTTLSPENYKYELGWIVSLVEKKGNGGLITKILQDHKSKIYSTVRKENIGMNKIISRTGFQKTGDAYKSTRGNYYNFLYIK